jgi:hypothetical protein
MGGHTLNRINNRMAPDQNATETKTDQIGFINYTQKYAYVLSILLILLLLQLIVLLHIIIMLITLFEF